ncbi:MAG: hypothetical protein ABIX12_08850 [Rubrivivax sp.]
MSFSVSLHTAAASTAAQSLAAVAHDPTAGAGSGSHRMHAALEDIPLCGTPVPGHPPLPHTTASMLDRVALNPQPLPPKETSIGASLAGRLSAYDDGDWCGTVVRKLPHFPPPPPGPWADLVAGAGAFAC